MLEQALFYKNFLDTSKTLASDLLSNIHYPWEVLTKIKEFVIEMGNHLPKNKYEQIKENVWVAKSAKIADFVSIEGPTIIQPEADIRHCAFIRGSAIVGKNVVVGNSSEIKNSILFDYVQVPHFNYVGDSILGYRAHLGAGVILSNLKSDKSEIKVSLENKKIHTGLKKFGAIIGDFVEIGCNAVLNPGTILGKNCSVYPTSMVRGFLGENMIFKNSGQIIKKT